MLVAILVLFFIFFSSISIILIRFLRLRADKIIMEAEANLDALYMEFQAKKVLYLTIISIMVFAIFGLILTRNVIFGVFLGVLGYFMPKFYFRIQKKRRTERLNQQLVDAIEMMSNAMKSGSNLPQAILLIQEEMESPIAQEFAMVTKEMAIGITLEESLNNMVARVGSQEFDIVVTATNIAQETGGNLAEIYDRIAKTIRDRNMMRGKIKALTAEGKFQGIFVGLLPFILGGVLYLMDPEMMKPMFTTFIGYIILAVIVIMELIGAFFIKKIITIDV
jgi:tight adherence protein B